MDKGKLISFKDLNLDWINGIHGDELLNRAARKRRLSTHSEGGPIGESADEVEEAVSREGRRKLSISAKKNAKKNARKREIAAKKKADPEKLKKRAMKRAREMVKKKLLKGKDTSEMPPSFLEQIEKKLDAMKGKIAKIAQRILPDIKKAEEERIQRVRDGDSAT